MLDNFDRAMDIWHMTQRKKRQITCSQKYGKLGVVTKWLMDHGVPYYVDDSIIHLDDEAGYKISLFISDVELAGLDESIGPHSFVYVE